MLHAAEQQQQVCRCVVTSHHITVLNHTRATHTQRLDTPRNATPAAARQLAHAQNNTACTHTHIVILMLFSTTFVTESVESTQHFSTHDSLKGNR